MRVKKLTYVLGLSLISTVAMAKDFAEKSNPWLIRARSIWVTPESSSTYLSSGAGVKVTDVSSDWAPELDINYFFSPSLSAELILATTTHDATGTGDMDLGSVSLLPPTVTAVYHFKPESRVSPYLGAGLNYTFFYDVDSGDVNSIKYENAFGLALQAGMDVNIDKTWSINFDAKKIFLNTDVNVDTTGQMDDSLNLDLNPWIFGVGVGYKFQ